MLILHRIVSRASYSLRCHFLRRNLSQRRYDVNCFRSTTFGSNSFPAVRFDDLVSVKCLRCFGTTFGKQNVKSEVDPSNTEDFPKVDFSAFDDYLFQLLATNEEKVPVSSLLRALRNAGLWKNDPRLAEAITHMQQFTAQADGSEVVLDKHMFRQCIRDNIVLIRRALTGDFIIPEFSKFCAVIDDIYRTCRTHSDGKVSTYVPQLARYSPDYWGVSLCTIDGQRHSIGDVDVPFTIQSGSMPINYALALNELGPDVVHRFVGHEPSGESFAHIKLSHDKLPHNPLINSGALVVASLIKRGLVLSDRFDYVMSQYRRMTGGQPISFNNSMFLSEKEIAHRNYALGYYMMENKCFPDDGVNLQDTMDLYFQLCSLEMNVHAGAVMAATLANGGYCPITNDRILDATSVRNTLSLMHSCGMYEYSGGFAFKVGLPAKASISGMMLLVVPNVMGMCLWSPPLDSTGNSVRSLKFCEELVGAFNFHHYDNLKRPTQKSDPRLRQSDVQGARVVNLLFGAFSGDLTALRRMALANQDMTVIDYDGRTALHIAASEGHLDCVKFLIEKCLVPMKPNDRWGGTPLDDALRFGHDSVVKYLEKCYESLDEPAFSSS